MPLLSFLVLVLVLVLCFASDGVAGGVRRQTSDDDACIALNFRAAALQGSDDACALLGAVIGSGGDILAGDATDVDASCGGGGGGGGGGGAAAAARDIPEEGEEGADNRTTTTTTTSRDGRQCIDDVMEVVDGISRGGCEITGG